MRSAVAVASLRNVMIAECDDHQCAMQDAGLKQSEVAPVAMAIAVAITHTTQSATTSALSPTPMCRINGRSATATASIRFAMRWRRDMTLGLVPRLFGCEVKHDV